ncbi:MAG: hypothetical protein IJU13_06470 [Bacteroidales bacterium]|nr:hypothetical protein [Bacteroidales bacterium]
MKQDTLPKVLVIFHIFYRDQIPWFLSKLAHINHCRWDLAVTGPSLQEEDRQAILAFKPDTRFVATDNVGYDVWPFIQVLQQTDLSPYAFIVKLHTKGLVDGYDFRYNHYHIKAMRWRDSLVDALLESDFRWRRVLHIFKHEKNAGMVCSRKLIILSDTMPEDNELLDEELAHLGIQCDDRRFCAGTMFAVRPKILEPILRRGLKKEDFQSDNTSHSGGTLAHVYERVFCLIVRASGYKMRPTGSWLSYYGLKFYYNYIAPVLLWIFEIDRENIEGFKDGPKYLRIFGLKFYL